MENNLDNNIFYYDYIIIGSGLSGLTASNQLLDYKRNHIILTSPFSAKNLRKDKNNKFSNSVKSAVSPKLNILKLQKEIKYWLSSYKLNRENFNLVQVLSNSIGGLSNYWGANLGHNYNDIIESNIKNIIEVNKADQIKDTNNIKMHSDLSEALLNLNKRKKKCILVHSPFLGIKLVNDSESLCKKCNAYYCNCDGKILQEYKFNKKLIKEIEIQKIRTKNNIFTLSGIDKYHNEKEISCKYLIFACGPFASAILFNKIKKIPENLTLNHNGLFSFPFISPFKIKNKPLALSNINISIHSKRVNNGKDPEAYTNIFPLKPQLVLRYPFLKYISQSILDRLYYCVVYTDSSFVESKFNIKNKKVIGKYKNKFFLFSFYTYLRLILFLFINGYCLPLFIPIFSKPGSDIHYGSTLANIKLNEEWDKRIFFSDSSRIKKISSINSTIKNLIFAKKNLISWLNKHSLET